MEDMAADEAADATSTCQATACAAYLHPSALLAHKRLHPSPFLGTSDSLRVLPCRSARTIIRMQGGEEKNCASRPGKVLFSFEEARKYARSFGFSSREEFEEYGCAGAYRLPKRPDLVYPKDWKGWDDWLGTMLPFSEARARARESGIRSEEEWRARAQEGPDEWMDARIPVKPDSFPPYAEDWKGEDDDARAGAELIEQDGTIGLESMGRKKLEVNTGCRI